MLTRDSSGARAVRRTSPRAWLSRTAGTLHKSASSSGVGLVWAAGRCGCGCELLWLERGFTRLCACGFCVVTARADSCVCVCVSSQWATLECCGPESRERSEAWGRASCVPGPLQQVRGITSNIHPRPLRVRSAEGRRGQLWNTHCARLPAVEAKVDLRGTSVLDVHHPTRETTHSAWQLVYVLLARETSLWARPRRCVRVRTFFF